VFSKRFDLLSPAIRPPSLDLSIRIIIKLDVVLRAVSPLVRIAIWDRPALEFRSHSSAHRVIARPLIRTVGQMEDLLVQTG
jgi:hypothetical protein